VEISYRVVRLKDCAEVQFKDFPVQEEAISDFNTVREDAANLAVDSLEVWKVIPLSEGPSKWELVTEWALENSL
jgi:hypothetical protein